MAISLAYTPFKTAMFGTGTRVDLDADVIKARLINTTVDYPNPNPAQSSMSTVPKYLASTDQILGSPSVPVTAAGGANLRSTVAFDAADATFPAIAADAGKVVDAICIFKFGTNDADSIPLWLLTGFTPLTPASATITVAWANTINRLLGNSS